MSTMNHRLDQFRKAKHLSGRKISLLISPSGGYWGMYIANGKSMASDKLEMLHKLYPDLNMDWVITGRGKMWCNVSGPAVPLEAEPCEAVKAKQKRLSILGNGIKEQPAPVLS